VHFGGGPTAVWVSCCAGRASSGERPEGGGPEAGAGGAALVAAAGLGGAEPGCYCRRAVEEFRREALAAAGQPADAGGPVSVLCVTCGVALAEDTQCLACRRARQRASRERFTARQAQVVRAARRRASGR
jgi:hypothetical protein